ncbi:MAG: DUF418 domain-containing protein [Planctomycetes bacterium]|nr:DUF418 domain-containing protein [Planctomycetota bacterium]
MEPDAQPETLPAPDPDASPRVPGFDVARALAVFGMILVNYELVLKAAKSGPTWLANLTQLLQGRAAATFVVLAGVGVTLGARRAVSAADPEQIRRVRLTLWKRALFLLVVGLAYLTIWPADILQFYAFYLGLGAFAITWSSARLWLASVGFVFVFLVLLLTLDYEAGWNFATLSYSGLWTARGLARRLLFNGFHPVFPWTAFLLVGMWLGRQRLTAPRTCAKVFVVAASVALVTELGSRALVSALLSSAEGLDPALVQALAGTSVMPPMPQYLLAAGGTAVALISLCAGVVGRLPARWVRPMVLTGQLALTLYVSHVVIGMGVLQAMGALDEGRSLVFSVSFGAGFFLCCVVFSCLWRQRWDHGPLEALMRRITG